MGVLRLLVGAVPLFFVTVGLASATTGALAPAGRSHPVAGTMLVLVGLTLFASLWLVGWWRGGPREH